MRRHGGARHRRDGHRWPWLRRRWPSNAPMGDQGDAVHDALGRPAMPEVVDTQASEPCLVAGTAPRGVEPVRCEVAGEHAAAAVDARQPRELGGLPGFGSWNRTSAACRRGRYRARIYGRKKGTRKRLRSRALPSRVEGFQRRPWRRMKSAAKSANSAPAALSPLALSSIDECK